MAAFNALKVGDVLYQSRKTKMGNTSMSTLSTWRVVVKELDTERRRALVSWNGNQPKWWYERELKPLRRTEPKTRRTIAGAVVRA